MNWELFQTNNIDVDGDKRKHLTKANFTDRNSLQAKLDAASKNGFWDEQGQTLHSINRKQIKILFRITSLQLLST